MTVTWLGHSGLIFKNDRITILVDPYLSNALGESMPEKCRRFDADESFFDIEPDVILITHAHADHLDPKTLDRYLSEGRSEKTVIASPSAFDEATALGGSHNYVLLAPHSVYSVNGVTFYSVNAAHTDPGACGFIIDDGDMTAYVAGDTLYNYDVIDDVLDLAPDGVDHAFLPINGRGSVMNAKDAADFAYEIGAHAATPVHYGLIDSEYPTDPEEFDFEDAVILRPFLETEIFPAEGDEE